MKTITTFILLIYWSILIFAPVISKDNKFNKVKINMAEQSQMANM
jgi:hypothetical protein